MACNPNTLYVTFVDVDRNLLKIWGQRNRIGASYIERQLLNLVPEFGRGQSPDPSRIRKGMLCYAKCSEGNYYRVRVFSNVQDDSVAVLFVDFGNRNVIPISNIRMPNESEDVLLKMSEQAEEFYLARIIAPAGGWTKEIISEIRHYICYEEFAYKEMVLAADQKLIEILFRNEDFSNLLTRKQLAQVVPINIQSQFIMSYCNFTPNDARQSSSMRELPKANCPVPSPQLGRPISSKSQQDIPTKESQQQYNFTRPPSNVVNFSQPSPSQDPSSEQMNPALRNAIKPSLNDLYFNSMRGSFKNENPGNLHRASFDPLMYQKCNPMLQNQMKGKQQFLNSYNNNNMIEALAQQIKQYIAESNANSMSNEEKIPHNYVNSVLEVGSTHNVVISCIDDGPWSFSIQLVSSENELKKLMKELTFAELVPIKPAIVLGHPCIGTSAIYRTLCRGVVVSISHSAVKVYFVDFGDTEDLAVSSIYELPQKFFKTRVLSQKFCLSGLQNVTYSAEIKNQFKEVVQNEMLLLQVTSLEGDNLPSCELYIRDKNIKQILNEKVQTIKSSLGDSDPEIGEIENVVVTWVDSPQKFYVQLRKRDAELIALKDELRLIDKTGQRVMPEELRVGLKCICKYKEDGQWYRAMITSFTSEKSINVFYVDYGNVEMVDISLLRKPNKSGLINQMSNQAILCSLHGFESKPYNQVISNKLENLILERDLRMVIVSANESHLFVKLFAGNEDIGLMMLKSYQEELEKQKESQHYRNEKNLSGENQRPSSSNITEKSPENVEISRTCDRIGSKVLHGEQKRREENENCGVGKRKPIDGDFQHFHRNEKNNKEIKQDKENHWSSRNQQQTFGVGEKSTKNQIWKERKQNGGDEKFGGSRGSRKEKSERKNFKQGFDGDRKKTGEIKDHKGKLEENANSGFDSNGKKLEKRKKNLNETHQRKSKEEDQNSKKHRQHIKKDELAPSGSAFTKKLVNIGHSEKAIVTYYVNPYEFYVQLLNNEEDFKKMMHDIQVYYSDKYSIRHLVKEGDIVIAQFSYDNVLYRGEVVNSVPLTVRYVDYGNQEEVKQMQTWLVAKQFLHLPRQACKCRLANLKPIESDWLSSESKLEKFFESEEYVCRFLNFENDVYEIEMESLDTGKNIAWEIIANGYGVPNRPDLDIIEIDFSLLPKQILKLHVTHVENEGKFYVLLNPEGARIIEEEIKYFTDHAKVSKPFDEVSSTLCLVTDDNLNWLRGTVLGVKDGQVSVWLNDRGNTVSVTRDKIRPLPEYLKSFQPQAVECYLTDVSEAISAEAFKSAVENKDILVSIVSENDQRLAVVLYDRNGIKLNFHIDGQNPRRIEPIGQLPIIGQGVPLIISHLVSPNEIYILRKIDQDKMVDLSLKLASFYQDGDRQVKFDGKVGDLVVAKSIAYESWYRARVVDSSPDTIEVFYLDLGKREILPRENAKAWDEIFYETNSFVRKVCLDSFKGSNADLKWLTRAEEVYGYFFNENGKFFSKFVVGETRVTPTLKSNESDEDGLKNIIIGGDKFTESREDREKSIGDAMQTYGTEDDSDNLKVFIIHIDSPKRFWVHKETSVNDLQKFQEKLQKACETVPDNHDPDVNETVATLFTGMWYRAVVLGRKGSIFTVKFVDYGNEIDIDLKRESVKKLSEDLISVPSFATEFALRGNWKESATVKFEEIILGYEDPVSAVILEETEPPLVDLFKDGQSIIETLIREGVGAANEGTETDLTTVYVTHSNSPCDFYVQRENSTELLKNVSEGLHRVESFEDVVSRVKENEIYAVRYPEDGSWYRGKVLKNDGNRMEVFFIDYGNVSNATEIKRLPGELGDVPPLSEHYSLVNARNSDVWSEEACRKFAELEDGRPLKMKMVVERAGKSIVRLFDGDRDLSEELGKLCENDGRSEVYVSHVNSPTDFYIQHVNDDKFKSIAKAIENGSKFQEDLVERKPGSLCLAGFVGDGLWYRARVLKNFDEDGCEVLFVDWGKTLVSTELKKPIADIMEIPPRAIRCSLNLAERNITESVKEEFIKLTSGGDRIFRARVITTGDVNVISLKLDGRIIEQTLSSDSVASEMEGGRSPSRQTLSGSLDDETDDEKNSKKTIMAENYLGESLEDDLRDGGSLRNETDEEKRIKIAISNVDGTVGSEGFKSDDEKGILTGAMVNVTDNDLMEEFHDSVEEQPEFASNHPETVDGTMNIVEVDRARTTAGETNAEERAKDKSDDPGSSAEGNARTEEKSPEDSSGKVEQSQNVERTSLEEEIEDGKSAKEFS